TCVLTQMGPLLVRSGSPVPVLSIDAQLVAVPGDAAAVVFTTMVALTVSPEATVPRSQVTTPGDVSVQPAEPPAKVVPAGRLSLKKAPLDGLGPLLRPTKV